MSSQDEDEYWQARIRQVRRKQVDTVRKSAATWLTLFAAILGVFTTVTFSAGLAGLNDLESNTRNIVRGEIAIAVVAMFMATILAGSVASTWPRRTSDLTGDAFRLRAKRQAGRGLIRLRLALFCGALAATLVVHGALLVVFAAKSSAQRPPMVATVNGRTYCGQTVMQPDGTLSIATAPLHGTVSLNGATLVTTIAYCP